MISTESGYEEWLEERRVAFEESGKKLYHKFQLSREKRICHPMSQ